MAGENGRNRAWYDMGTCTGRIQADIDKKNKTFWER